MKKLLMLALSCLMIVGNATLIHAQSNDISRPDMLNYNLTIKNMKCDYDRAYAIYKRLVEVRKEHGLKTSGKYTKGAQALAMQRAAEYCVTAYHIRPNLKDSLEAGPEYHYISFIEDLAGGFSGYTPEEGAKKVLDTWLSDNGHMKDIYAYEDLSGEIGVGYVDGMACLVTDTAGDGQQDTSDAITSGTETKDFVMPFGTLGKSLSPRHTDDRGVILDTLGYIDLAASTNPDYGTAPETKEYTVKPGDEMTLYVYQEAFTDQMTPEDIAVHSGLQVAPECFTWSSSDPNVASVDASGKVTAKSEGTAEISYALSDTLKNTITVNVKTPETPKPKDISGATVVRNDSASWLEIDGKGIPGNELNITQTSNNGQCYYKVDAKDISYTGTTYLKGTDNGISAMDGYFSQDARIISEAEYNAGIAKKEEPATVTQPSISSPKKKDETPSVAEQIAAEQAEAEKTEKSSSKAVKEASKVPEKKSSKKSKKGSKKTSKKASKKATKKAAKKASKKTSKKNMKISAPKKLTIRKGKYVSLKVRITNKSKKTKVTYKVSSKKLKIKKGKVKASKKGTYTVTVKAGKLKKKIRIVVK